MRSNQKIILLTGFSAFLTICTLSWKQHSVTLSPESSRAGALHPQKHGRQKAKPRVWIVLARHDENVAWVEGVNATIASELPDVSAELRIYQTPSRESFVPVDSKTAETFKFNGSIHDQPKTPTIVDATVSMMPLYLAPVNRGCEAMLYLTAIIDALRDPQGIPDYIIFAHAHWWGPHGYFAKDFQIYNILNTLSSKTKLSSNLDQLDYLSLQCANNPPGWNHWYLKNPEQNMDPYKSELVGFLVKAWDEYFGPAGLGDRPERLLSPANSEFIISKAALSSRPTEFWVDARHWLLSTSNFITLDAAIAMEYLWAMIFTNQPIVDVPQEECLCHLYDICSPFKSKIRDGDGYFEAHVGPRTTYRFDPLEIR